MLGAIAKAVFGSSNERYVKSLDKIVKQINALEPQIETLSDEELAAQTAKFREQVDGARPSTTSFRRLSPPSAKRPSACSACAISTSR